MGRTGTKQNRIKAGIELAARTPDRTLLALSMEGRENVLGRNKEVDRKAKAVLWIVLTSLRLLYSITSYQISRYNIIQYQIKSTEIM